MKFIHTSDWHLGQTLYSYDRTDEHLYFFRQLKDIAITHRPDALLVSGDIFDVSSPSASSMRMFTDFILDLHDSVPDMTIIITSGNHDSASRIDVNRNLWKKTGIHVIGNVRKNDGNYDFSDNLITIPDKGTVLAIPYINRAYMRDESSEKERALEECFFRNASEYVCRVNDEANPCILMAHLTVENCDMTGHRTPEIGNINSVKQSIFGHNFDYVALGHIHRAQNLDRTGKIRYSGSPVAIGFDEEYPHTVSIVEINKGEPPVVNEIEIHPLRELKTFPYNPIDFKKAIRQLEKFPSDDNSYIRLNVEQEEDLPSDCMEQASSATKDKSCRFCIIKFTRPDNPKHDKGNMTLNISQFSELEPDDIACRYFRACGLPDSQIERYLSLISQLQNEYALDKSI